MAKRKIIVIGGGASGLMAAGQAAKSGANVLLLEKMKRPGRKLCITGKGRCNITNITEITDFINHFGKKGQFLRQAFSQYFSNDLMVLFEEQGLKLVKERGGRVFPASGKAPDVLEVFLKWLNQCKVKIKHSCRVRKLIINNGCITSVVSNNETFPCDAVVLATGGASYPRTGSTGDGYRLAESAGHTVIPVRPALVPLETAGKIAGKMTDLNLRNINVQMFVNNKKRKEAFGELVFARFGVTGPVILTLSGDAVDALNNKNKVTLSIDLKPALSEQKLDNRLLRDFAKRGNEQISSILRGLLPREMVPVCISLTGIPSARKGGIITAEERKRLLTWLKDFRLEVTGYRPFDEAIVTAGGVDTREINPKTMESLKTRGLFLAGEVIDINGDTGGYNLQAAFSTGWLAGRAAAM
ncbi:NAD(P)/FAD-dependent oxidoreductase [Verrucomicrobiota bacterium]